MATESGSDVFRSNTAISCVTPLSAIRKFCLLRCVSSAPVASRTETSSRTRFTFTEKIGDSAGGCVGVAGLNCPHESPAVPTRSSALRTQQALIPFPIDPHRSIGEMLFLPDRDFALEPVNALERRIEGRFPVRRRRYHRDTRFSDFEPPQPVYHADSADRELSGNFTPDLLHVCARHFLIAFVFQIHGGPALAVVAYYALKYDYRAVFGTLQGFGEPPRVYPLPGNPEHVSVVRSAGR